jgi:hypothetical protein
MKRHSTKLRLILVGTGWTLLFVGCEQADTMSHSQIEPASPDNPQPITGKTAEPAQNAPLLLDEPVLLLDEEPATEGQSGPAADNSRCLVCHVNYTQEKLAVTHARAGMGCADCHGPSDAHIADESWASGGNGTAPDVMYPREKINPSCMACHPRERLATPQHDPIFVPSPGQKVCTDCHGDHRLPQRRCKWK